MVTGRDMSYGYQGAPPPMLLGSVRDYVRGLSLLQRVSAVLAVLGTLLMYLATVFHWYHVTLSTVYEDRTTFTTKRPVSVGTLVLGDTEEQFTNPFAGLGDDQARPDYTSNADLYALVYVVLSIFLVLMVYAALMTQGSAQLWLRAGAGVCAIFSLMLVILISADLRDMSEALRDFMVKERAESLVGAEVEPAIGAGLLLAAIASLLLGVSAGFNQASAAAATGSAAGPGSPAAPPGSPAAPVSAPAPAHPHGYATPPAAPMSAPPGAWAPTSGVPAAPPPRPAPPLPAPPQQYRQPHYQAPPQPAPHHAPRQPPYQGPPQQPGAPPGQRR